MKEYKIASIAGDGIGKEVLPEGLKILKEVAKQHQFKLTIDEFDFASCDYYEKHGKCYQMIGKKKLVSMMQFFLELLVILKDYLIMFHCGDHC